MNVYGRVRIALLAMMMPILAVASSPSVSAQMLHVASGFSGDVSPLIDKVRNATARYKDINVALAEGWVQATPCVSGPDFGAMGVHFVMPARLADGVLRADQPEALIYEPMSNGAYRLVGAEFIVFASVWASQHPGGGTPALEGHLFNFIDAPNRYGLPALYELHVWAWEQNAVGSFADWNTGVSCDQQPST
jgi:hypothetical protein